MDGSFESSVEIDAVSAHVKQPDMSAKIPKKRRYKSGTVVKRMICKYQKSTELLLPKASFRRLVNEITSDMQKEVRYSGCAISALQEAVEVYLTEILHSANEQCIHGDRKTILPKDVQIVVKSHGPWK